MSKINFNDEFKRDAVAQITERGYRVWFCHVPVIDGQSRTFWISLLS